MSGTAASYGLRKPAASAVSALANLSLAAVLRLRLVGALRSKARRIESVLFGTWTSLHRNASSSFRRAPVAAARATNGYSGAV